MTITGLIIILISFIFQKSGIEIGTDGIQTTIEVIIQLAGLFIAWWGRYKQKDITIMGRYKDKTYSGSGD